MLRRPRRLRLLLSSALHLPFTADPTHFGANQGLEFYIFGDAESRHQPCGAVQCWRVELARGFRVGGGQEGLFATCNPFCTTM